MESKIVKPTFLPALLPPTPNICAIAANKSATIPSVSTLKTMSSISLPLALRLTPQSSTEMSCSPNLNSREGKGVRRVWQFSVDGVDLVRQWMRWSRGTRTSSCSL